MPTAATTSTWPVLAGAPGDAARELAQALEDAPGLLLELGEQRQAGRAALPDAPPRQPGSRDHTG